MNIVHTDKGHFLVTELPTSLLQMHLPATGFKFKLTQSWQSAASNVIVTTNKTLDFITCPNMGCADPLFSSVRGMPIWKIELFKARAAALSPCKS